MIIAIKEKDRIVVGCTFAYDFDGLPISDSVDPDNLPLAITPSGRIYGFVSLMRASDLLLYDEEFKKIEATPKAIVREMIPYMKKAFKENGIPIGKDEYWKNALVICEGDHLYDIDTSFNFSEISDYVCHGIDTHVLRSVLDLTEGKPAEERIVEAIRFYDTIKRRNDFPIVITDTQTRRFTCVYEGGEK